MITAGDAEKKKKKKKAVSIFTFRGRERGGVGPCFASTAFTDFAATNTDHSDVPFKPRICALQMQKLSCLTEIKPLLYMYKEQMKVRRIVPNPGLLNAVSNRFRAVVFDCVALLVKQGTFPI